MRTGAARARLLSVLRNSSLLGLAVLLSACGAADSFAPRAVDYNEEASTSKSSQILLNIVRAAYTYPLQFTDLSTVTGQATASFTTGSNLPLFGTRATSARLFTFSPGITISGGPSFNIANLNSQEFYNGIQSQIDKKTIQHYLFAGYDPRIILPLFISEISTPDAVLRNTATDSASYFAFYSALLSLIDAGLSMEPAKETSSISPPLTQAQAIDPKLLAGLVSASGSDSGTTPTLKRYILSKKDDPNLTDAERRNLEHQHADTYYRLVKSSTSYVFCFDRRNSKPYPYVDLSVRSAASAAVTTLRIPVVRSDRSAAFVIEDTHPVFCGEKPKAAAEPAGKTTVGEKISLGKDVSIKLRSVEEIFLFLGDVVRTEMGLATGKPASLTVPLSGGRALNLFRVERRAPGPGEIAASLDGQTFVISPDPTRANASTTVVQLLTDLLALNSSAKSLPAPNIIPFVTGTP